MKNSVLIPNIMKMNWTKNWQSINWLIKNVQIIGQVLKNVTIELLEMENFVKQYFCKRLERQPGFRVIVVIAISTC